MAGQGSLDVLYHLRSTVDNYLLKLVSQHAPHQREIILYALGLLDKDMRVMRVSSGKRVRPALCLLTYDAIADDRQRAVPLASAVELFHTFTLVHDDIMDRDEERRGVPTLWKLAGDGTALTAGDALFALAFLALRDIPDPVPGKIMRIYESFAETGVQLSEGQNQDLAFEASIDIDLERYLGMVAGKTVALIEFATYSAAVLATDDQHTIEQMTQFGRNLGFAFQIRDDYLNIWSEDYKAMKTAYGDLTRKKKSFPIVYAMDAVDEPKREKILSIYSDPRRPMSADEQAFMLHLFDEIDLKGHAHRVVEQYTQRSLDILSNVKFGNRRAHEQLVHLTLYLLGRDI